MAVLDRSIIDNLAYAAVAGIKLDEKIYKDIAGAAYEKKVFYLELLKNYRTDEQRKDNETQVNEVHKELYKIYSHLGFELITVPIFADDKNKNILKRTEFILKHIENRSLKQNDKK